MDVAREATVHYHVIDRVDQKYHRGTFDLRQTQSFTVAYNVHDEDQDRQQHLSSSDTEQDVLKFEDEPVEVPLSSILEQIMFKESVTTKALPPREEIKTAILADKNKSLAKASAKTFTAKPQNDERFKSVVVVYTPDGGLGSGFYLREDIVLTNIHVIDGVNFVEMKLFDGQETFGKVVANDPRLDLALIKVQARSKPVAFFPSNEIPLGETVHAIGHPKGFEFSISQGVISSMREIESNHAIGGRK